MTRFMGLIKRNLLVFFKDTQTIVFSLMTSIIVFVLYLLFLRDTFVEAIESPLAELGELGSLVNRDDLEMFSNLTLLVGILGSAIITVPFNCLTTIVKDREKKIDYDILATPIGRWQIILAYFAASALSAVMITGIILGIGLLILGRMGDLHMDVATVLAAYGVLVLGAVSSTALFMIVVLFFRSSSASGAFFGMLSAASGFVIGAYIPISQFSGRVQTFCNLFPASHITILFRNVLLNNVLDSVESSIGGLGQGAFSETIRQIFVFRAHLFGREFGRSGMLVYVLAMIALCIVGMIILYCKTYKRKG